MGCGLQGRDLLVPPCPSQLTDDPVECGGHTLRAADVVLLGGRVPIQFERPSLGAVMQQATQREPDFGTIDPTRARPGNPRAQDMDR